jgi:hypothetical protein
MRKFHTMMQALMLLLLTAGVLVGCRKGEDDPWLTFRGRKARLVGKWSVTSGMVQRGAEFTTPEGNQVVGTSTSRYSETAVEQTNFYSRVQGDVTWSQTGDFSGKVEIFRDGTYSMSVSEKFKVGDANEVNNGGTYTGLWTLTGGNKGNNVRKREQLMLQQVSYTPVTGTGELNTNPVPSALYHLKQLKHKEIVLTYENNSSDALNTVKEEWTWSLLD